MSRGAGGSCWQPCCSCVRALCAQMLLLVGPALQAELRPLGFLLLYLAGGVLANLAAYAWNSSIKKRRRWTFQARLPSLSSAQHAGKGDSKPGMQAGKAKWSCEASRAVTSSGRLQRWVPCAL